MNDERLQRTVHTHIDQSITCYSHIFSIISFHRFRSHSFPLAFLLPSRMETKQKKKNTRNIELSIRVNFLHSALHRHLYFSISPFWDVCSILVSLPFSLLAVFSLFTFHSLWVFMSSLAERGKNGIIFFFLVCFGRIEGKTTSILDFLVRSVKKITFS